MLICPLWCGETFSLAMSPTLVHVSPSAFFFFSFFFFVTPSLSLHPLDSPPPIFWLALTCAYTHVHKLLLFPPVAGFLLGSMWYLGSDKSSSHFAFPNVSQAGLIHASFSGPITSNVYGKPPWLQQTPASTSWPTEKQEIGKTTVEHWRTLNG